LRQINLAGVQRWLDSRVPCAPLLRRRATTPVPARDVLKFSAQVLENDVRGRFDLNAAACGLGNIELSARPTAQRMQLGGMLRQAGVFAA
jgi:hypothetical protein